MEKKIKYPSVSYSSLVPVYTEEDPDFPTAYRQVAYTRGLARQGYPELETLLTRSQTNYSVLNDALQEIRRNGTCFAEGDRFTFGTGGYRYTVEFRRSYAPTGPCLRIVLPGVEETFQSLPANMAADLIDWDPDAFDLPY